jgi:predicted amidohydrolase YtcJ
MRFSEKLRPLLVLAAVVFALAASGDEAKTTIYLNGQVIIYKDTPEGYDTVDAVAVRDGKILAVGTVGHVLGVVGGGAEKIDLKQKTLIPGFFDGHSHFTQVAYLPVFAKMFPPPDEGKADSIKAIQDILIGFRKANPGQKALIGIGYDDSQLDTKKHPDKADLDQVAKDLSEDIPIMIIHQSTHYGVANTRALETAGVTKNGKLNDPVVKEIEGKGGVIYKYEGTSTPNGLLGEFAFLYMLSHLGIQPVNQKLLEDGMNLYIRQGFTTVEEGRTNPDFWDSIESIFTNNKDFKFKVDAVTYIGPEWIPEWMGNHTALPGEFGRGYDRGFRVAGIKLVLDGSPQGRSAWFTEPYVLPPDGKTGYKGQPNIQDADVIKFMADAYKQDRQLLVHVNGDAAIDQLIRAEHAARNELEKQQVPVKDRRTVLIHGQFLRANQIESIKYLKFFPSLFPMHTYYWGDWYREIVGPERAAFISPTRALQDAGMMFSIHSDAPVTPPDSMRLLDSAVNRITRTGYVLGKDQRISPIVALKALTLWPAYQHFEEKTKGSIEVGKLADFAVLSHNPMKLKTDEERMNLLCIQIIDTIKSGQSVYPSPRPADVTGDQGFAERCRDNRSVQ